MIPTIVKFCLPLAAFATLSACVPAQQVSTPAPTPPPAAALRTGSASDERACELAVTRETKNPEVVTLSSDMSQANTEVVIGVGPKRAKWRCLVSRGKVSEVMSLTDEGKL